MRPRDAAFGPFDARRPGRGKAQVRAVAISSAFGLSGIDERTRVALQDRLRTTTALHSPQIR